MPGRYSPSLRGAETLTQLARERGFQFRERGEQERLRRRGTTSARVSGSIERRRQEKIAKRARKTAKRKKRQAATLGIGLGVAGAAAGGLLLGPALSASAGAAGAAASAGSVGTLGFIAGAPAAGFSLAGAGLGASLGTSLAGGISGTGGDIGGNIYDYTKAMTSLGLIGPKAGGNDGIFTGADIQSALMSLMMASDPSASPANLESQLNRAAPQPVGGRLGLIPGRLQ